MEKLIIGVLKLIVWLVKAAAKAIEERTGDSAPRLPPPKRSTPPARPAPARPVTTRPAATRPTAAPKPAGPPALALARSVDELATRAAAVRTAAEQQRGARRFLPAIGAWVPDEIAWIRRRISADGNDLGLAQARLQAVARVVHEVERMAADRRNPRLAADLGDADALATACYQPIITHARAEGLPLTVAEPATRWGDYNLSIATGFVPTGVAPIFLPRDFFARTEWWPALAHEIGHSFLASVRDLEDGLRTELGLVSETTGLRPLDADNLTRAELQRMVSGWFEELFCDVFGTLMCGPAYVRTMTTLFADEANPEQVIAVAVGPSGTRYDMHPPRHLRVLAACRVLKNQGLAAEATALRRDWDARHPIDGEPPACILFPTAEATLAIPLGPLEAMVGALAARLCEGPFTALGGFGLDDISGLDYGPHEHAEGLRARDALLAGRAPTVRDPRAVIAGAVLAAHQRPDLEARILEDARAAIPAVDTGETRPDAYGRRRPIAISARADELRDAMVLRAILERPRAVRPGLRRR